MMSLSNKQQVTRSLQTLNHKFSQLCRIVRSSVARFINSSRNLSIALASMEKK